MSEKITPAIIAIAYNRPKALLRLLTSLNKAQYHEGISVPLIISIDKSSTDEVEKVANDFEWKHGEKIINARKENMGLKKHVLSCGDYTKIYGSIIVLEDDLYVAGDFYHYAIKALEFTQDDDRIAGVSLYNHLLNVHAREPFMAIDDGYDNWYFAFASSWGQAYTANQWQSFVNWYEINKEKKLQSCYVPENVSGWSDKSWLKFYIKYVIDTKKYFLYPRVSRTTNFSDVGEHAVKLDTDVQVPLYMGNNYIYRFSKLEESSSVYDAFFENEKLSKCLSMGADVIVDIYGLKDYEEIARDNSDSRYLLSQKALPYKIVDSFSRALRPIDANVIEKITGDDIFLYDLTKEDTPPKVCEADRYLYDYRAISAKRMMEILKYRVGEKFHK